MAIQPAGAANGSHASLGPFPVSHSGTLMVFTEANSNLNRVIGQSVQHKRMSVLGVYVDNSRHSTRRTTCDNKHLLARKQFPLILVDDGVTRGNFAVLVPSNWTLEVSWVRQTIGSCKTCIHDSNRQAVQNIKSMPKACKSINIDLQIKSIFIEK